MQSIFLSILLLSTFFMPFRESGTWLVSNTSGGVVAAMAVYTVSNPIVGLPSLFLAVAYLMSLLQLFRGFLPTKTIYRITKIQWVSALLSASFLWIFLDETMYGLYVAFIAGLLLMTHARNDKKVDGLVKESS